MKKVILSIISGITVISLLFVFCACSKDMNGGDMTSTTIPEASTTQPIGEDEVLESKKNDGEITDVSEKNDNGAIGDAVTDISEIMSDVANDVSRDVSEAAAKKTK